MNLLETLYIDTTSPPESPEKESQSDLTAAIESEIKPYSVNLTALNKELMKATGSSLGTSEFRVEPITTTKITLLETSHDFQKLKTELLLHQNSLLRELNKPKSLSKIVHPESINTAKSLNFIKIHDQILKSEKLSTLATSIELIDDKLSYLQNYLVSFEKKSYWAHVTEYFYVVDSEVLELLDSLRKKFQNSLNDNLEIISKVQKNLMKINDIRKKTNELFNSFCETVYIVDESLQKITTDIQKIQSTKFPRIRDLENDFLPKSLQTSTENMNSLIMKYNTAVSKENFCLELQNSLLSKSDNLAIKSSITEKYRKIKADTSKISTF